MIREYTAQYFMEDHFLQLVRIFKNSSAWLQVDGLNFRWSEVSLAFTTFVLLFTDLILSSFATVSQEVSFFRAVSQAAALISVWNIQSLSTLIASFGHILWQAEQNMQNSFVTLGLPFTISIAWDGQMSTQATHPSVHTLASNLIRPLNGFFTDIAFWLQAISQRLQ